MALSRLTHLKRDTAVLRYSVSVLIRLQTKENFGNFVCYYEKDETFSGAIIPNESFPFVPKFMSTRR